MALILRWDVPIDDLPHDIGAGQVIHIDCLEKLEDNNWRKPAITSIQVWTFEESTDKAHLYRRDVQVIPGAHTFPNDFKPLGSVVVPTAEAVIYHVVQLGGTTFVHGRQNV